MDMVCEVVERRSRDRPTTRMMDPNHKPTKWD
ncbi:hypothetical protein LIER_25286 [Lithospermum erythrorhizon]|uniref:Uncharacterized protein n=1 Tax=Lithospermum erythrorhizon TaxID=34254 RepID=A0AAV3R7E4_LITER